MRVSDKALILQRVKHADSKCILQLFTREHGMLSASVRVSTTGKNGIRYSAILPLNFAEVELLLRQNREIHVLTELNVYQSNTTRPGDILSLSLAQFMQEVLAKALREHHGSAALFDFLEACFELLQSEGLNPSNLLLFFLAELGQHLGVEPQNNYSESNAYFDAREGQFGPVALVWPLGLNQEESKLFSDFLKSEKLQFETTANHRRFLLELYLNYFAFHLPAFGQLKSPEILREILRT